MPYCPHSEKNDFVYFKFLSMHKIRQNNVILASPYPLTQLQQLPTTNLATSTPQLLLLIHII